MGDFLSSLFDTDDFPARWHCGMWTEAHGWTHIISDIAILCAYLAIPCALVYTLLRMRRKVPRPFPLLLVLFSLFIVSCGVTHLNEAIIFWHPIYRFAGLMKALTAVVSLATVAALIPTLPKVFALRTPSELEREVQLATESLRKERDAARRYAALVDSARDAIVSLSTSGDIVTWNQTSTRLFGFRATEVIGRELSGFVADRDEVRFSELLRKCRLGEPTRHTDVEWRHEDGHLLPVSITLSPIRGDKGEFEGVSIIARDIEDRLKAEQLFRKAVDASPSAMIATSDTGEIVLLNTQAERLFGFEREALLGKSIELLIPQQYRDHHPELRKAYQSNPEAREMGKGRELFAQRKDGNTFPVEVGLNPIETDEGPITLCAVVDRTEVVNKQKSLEDAIRNVNATNSMLRDRTDELARSNAELEQFAYVASHDLKAPMRGIQNAVAWISEDLPAELLNDDMKENLELLTSRSVRMESLIDGLLEYSRIGRASQKSEQVDVRELVASVVELMELGPDVVVEIGEELPSIQTFRTPLEHVFTNLIGNAYKHRDKDALRISIASQLEGEFVAFTVHDDGPGIDPKFHQKVFQIFQTIKPRDEVEGTGIGLAIVRKLVDSVGGQVDLSSVSGEGAAFRFTWPRTMKNAVKGHDGEAERV